jgi:hypothetical protein
MVVYGLALGNQRQLNGGDFSTPDDELWPIAGGFVPVISPARGYGPKKTVTGESAGRTFRVVGAGIESLAADS